MGNPKHLLIISYGRLIKNGTAGEAVMCGLVEAALRRGLRVTHVGVLKKTYSAASDEPFSPATNGDLLKTETARYDQRPGNRLESFLYNFDHAVLEYLTEPCAALEQPYDAAVAFESFPVSLAEKVQASAKIAILGDPVGQRLLHSSFLPWKRRVLVGAAAGVTEWRYFRRKLGNRWTIGMFGTSHARDASRIFKRPVLDLRPFLIRDGSGASAAANRGQVPGEKPVVVFGGTLATTASRLAFRFLYAELLPGLRATLGEGKFIFKVVGAYLDDYVSLSKRFPEVVLTGRVPVFEKELEGGDVFVLPMDYPVGVRTRVCAALQAGCYCICHPSVLVNMPELKECSSVAIAARDADYAAAIAKLPMDAASRRERKEAARKFFDGHYACDVAARPILDCIA